MEVARSSFVRGNPYCWTIHSLYSVLWTVYGLVAWALEYLKREAGEESQDGSSCARGRSGSSLYWMVFDGHQCEICFVFIPITLFYRLPFL